MAIVNNISSEIGDIVRIKTNTPIIGIVALNSFIDDVDGTSASVFYNKSFRYSVDSGLNFTDWFSLNNTNIQNISITTTDQFVIDYRYIHGGSEPTSNLELNNIQLSGDFQALQYPIYSRNIFNDLFDVNDVNVLQWAINVLEKLYTKGIVPDYILRKDSVDNPIIDDRDYIALFNTTTHFFAIIVNYARQFEKISENEILLPKFIESLGLFTNTNITTTHLQYLFNNYSNEFRKRGTNSIVEKSLDVNIPNGELLRLISYDPLQGFVFAQLEPHATGWCLGKSSPSFNYTRHCVNMVVGYEKTDKFVDIDKYPLIPNANNFSITNNSLNIDSVGVGVKIGIDSNSFDIDKAIVINNYQDYEIVVKIETASIDSVLYFGAKGYDKNGTQITMYNLKDQTNSDFFFEEKRLPRANKTYFINGIVFGQTVDKNIGSSYDLGLNIGYGSHLRVDNKDVVYIIPFIYLYSLSTSTPEATIHDFKIRPLKFNFTLGKLGLKNIIYSGYHNNSIYNNSKIYNNIVQYLISYDNNLINDNYIKQGLWILESSYWNDEGFWDDNSFWND